MGKDTKISTESIIEIEKLVEKEEKHIGEKDKHIKEDSTRNSQKSLRRFSLNHTLRSKVTSILLIVLAGIFTFSLLWMNYLTIKNKDLIEEAYKAHIITGDIVAKGNTSSNRGTGPISGKHIENLDKTDMIKDYKAIASMIYDELYRDRDGVIEKYEVGEKDKVHFHTNQPRFIVRADNKGYNNSDGIMELTELNFIDGYSLEDFYKEYTRGLSKSYESTVVDEKGEEGFPILVSNKAMEHFDLRLGDKIFLKPWSSRRGLVFEAYGTIVGTFEGVSRGKDYYGYSAIIDEELFIYPLSVLRATEIEVYYDKMEFEFKQDRNKELMERKEELRRMVANNKSNDYLTELKLWDEEITNVVAPLEKNISLLEVLYPITFILSIIIACILVFIMILRRSIDVAILRMLGVKGKEVRWNLFRENLVLVLIGIVIACITVFVISIKSYPIDKVKYVMVIGGYLLGTIVGLSFGIRKVTHKKPLEMLQVKE